MMTENSPPRRDASKKATNLYLTEDLLAHARRLGINISRACEDGLRLRIAEVEAKRWREENGDAIASSNEFVERQGIPLAGFRRF